MTLFNELQVTLEYYNRKTTGILMQVNVPNTYGYPGYWDNVGAMRNQGLEVSLAWHKTLGGVQLNFGGNFTYNKNEILSLGNVDVLWLQIRRYLPKQGRNSKCSEIHNDKQRPFNSW